MTVVAFDLGLHATGVAWPGGSDTFRLPKGITTTPMTDTARHARIDWWHRAFRAILEPWPHTDIWVEAPFLHPKHPTGAIPLIELHGALLVAASGNGSPVTTIAPAELKKWATGKGNASKAAMLEAARQRGWVGDDHNEADAWLLWCLAHDRGAL